MTFRLLHRAKKVLSDDNLRKQYDLLGFDLQDDEDMEDEETKTKDSFMTAFAGLVLNCVGNIGVRTLSLLVVVVYVCRYKIFVIPLMLCVVFISIRSYKRNGNNILAILIPLVIIITLIFLNMGETNKNSKCYWIAETTLQTVFTHNALPIDYRNSKSFFVLLLFLSLFALYTKGNVYKYLKLIAVEFVFAIVVVIVFPLLELIVEEIVKDKMERVGIRVRDHLKRMEQLIRQEQQP